MISLKANDMTPRQEWARELAVQIAAQCWCREKTSGTVMDPDLAFAFADAIAPWLETYAQEADNTAYYRGLVVAIGTMIGENAYIADDGTRMDDVLCAKVPELVDHLIYLNAAMANELIALRGSWPAPKHEAFYDRP
jgi:hypothetical protein